MWTESGDYPYNQNKLNVIRIEKEEKETRSKKSKVG